MRIVHKFKYKNKFFRAGEITVGDYLIFLEDFDYFIEKVLSEFNDKQPALDPDYLRAFLNILFGNKDDLDIFKSKKKKSTGEDFHIMLGIFMRQMKQGYQDVCVMPMRMFNKFLDDLECIMDPTKYDPNRNQTSPDREKIKKEFGGKSEIKG